MRSELVDEQLDFLDEQFASLTTALSFKTPSEWAEVERYLPQQAAAIPGPFRFAVTPYWREVVDCLSVNSPVREVTVMKGAQIGFTTAVLENFIGYAIAHVKSAPMMYVTADDQLAQARLTLSILPMLQESGLAHLISSSDVGNARKTGKTARLLEWIGGGMLIPNGARSPNKMRQQPIRFMCRDEIDGWPLVVGKDGDPLKLTAARCNSYEASYKLLDGSTPNVEETSRIADRFRRGDQRYYNVRCLRCGFPQVLRWNRVDNLTGTVSGIWWETDPGEGDTRVITPGSVHYICENEGCDHKHTNDDKTRLLAPDNGAKWKPTTKPENPLHRSYHLSALYSPPGMRTWEAIARDFLEAWDTEKSRVRNVEKLRVFYNSDLGVPFREQAERLRFETISPHRRIGVYSFGEIPNKWATEHAGGPIVLLVGAVDVHGDNLAVAVFGWCRGSRPFLIEYERFKGNTEQLNDPDTWGKLRDWIDNKEWVADDGKRYRLELTLIDSGYSADNVYEFASGFGGGVFPIKGRDAPTKSAKLQEFSEFETAKGTIAYGITVDMYKDRWGALLKRSWSGQGPQPEGHFNAPGNVTDAQLKELTAETKRYLIDKRTGQRLGTYWHRPSGAANELWDTLVYATAGLEMVAHDVCVKQWKRDAISWGDFFDACEFGTEAKPSPLFFLQ